MSQRFHSAALPPPFRSRQRRLESSSRAFCHAAAHGKARVADAGRECKDRETAHDGGSGHGKHGFPVPNGSPG
eukprot:5290276-Prymnesium_polylepis.1